MAGSKVEEREIDGEVWYKFTNEFQRRKYFYGNALTFILIIVLLVMGILLFNIMYKNIEEIKSNPFIYGAKGLSEKYGQEVSCMCFRGSSAFSFNTTVFDNGKTQTIYDR